MKGKLLCVSSLALLAAVAGTASAQSQLGGFYLGAGGEFGDFSINGGFNDGYSSSYSGAYFLAGYRGTAGPTYFWAGEVDYAMHSGNDVDSSLRLRGLFGRTFGRFDVYTALGAVMTDGPYPAYLEDFIGLGSSNPAWGFTYGIGTQVQITNRLSGRLEFIQDRFEGEGKAGSEPWTKSAVRAAAIFNF